MKFPAIEMIAYGSPVNRSGKEPSEENNYKDKDDNDKKYDSQDFHYFVLIWKMQIYSAKA
jgi:hypothetical protein